MPLPKWELAGGNDAVCTQCGSTNSVSVFPAALAQGSAARPEAAQEGEAACFDHPNKRAVAACAQCGRFVCQLCSVPSGGDIWCPSCVAAAGGPAKAANTETVRTLYDSITLTAPFATLLMWPLTILAAPATLILAALKWKRPISLVRRSRWRFVLGILVALAELGCWIWGILFFLARSRMANS
jgi:hypothetical protein